MRSSLKRKRERKEKNEAKLGLGLWRPPTPNKCNKMKETAWEVEAIGDGFEFEARLGYVVSLGPA